MKYLNTYMEEKNNKEAYSNRILKQIESFNANKNIVEDVIRQYEIEYDIVIF